MIQLNSNVVGTPTDTPQIADDFGHAWPGLFESPTRCLFRLDDFAANTGGHLRYDGHDLPFLIPEPGAHEFLELEYAPAASGKIRIAADAFVTEDGKRWPWKGATDFRLLAYLRDGIDIRPILEQRKNAGANLLRVLSMKANNTGWEYHPLKTDWAQHLLRLKERLDEFDLRAELTVFADTRLLENFARLDIQQAYWQQVCAIVREWGWPVELINEAGHSTQACDPQQFQKPSGMLSSHGSGGTDEDSVRPLWDYATYHAIRDTGSARAFTNMDPYEFQRDHPVPPKVADESAKPEQYGFSTDYAYRMGSHAAMGCGGTYHTSEGVNSLIWPPHVEACAVAFFKGCDR